MNSHLSFKSLRSLSFLSSLKSLIVFLAAALTFAACSQDDDPAATSGAPLQISVSVQGFKGDEVETRATDNGYTTTFGNGDKIGITVVANNGSTILQNNVPCTCNGGVWTPDGGAKIYAATGATCFAYYPYDIGNNGKLPAAIINDFTPKANQRLYADYTKSDLMTWSGSSPTGTSLQISLAHKLALLEVSLPEGVTIATLQIGADDITGKTYMHNGVHRYIVKPSTVTVSGTCTYTAGSFPVAWQKASVSLTAGQSTKVNMPIPITVNYTDGTGETVAYNLSTGRIPFTKTGKTIKSVVINEKNHLVGRKTESGDLKMKFDTNGDLQFREAQDGYIPIGSYAEFQLIRTNASFSKGKSFKQEADLDLMNEGWNPIWNESDDFSGTFDGAGKQISNLNSSSGPFLNNRGTIRNVHIVSGRRTFGYSGGICTLNKNTGIIIACSNARDIEAIVSHCGGIVAINNGTITACRNTGNVNGGSWLAFPGGVAGENDNGTIIACYNTGNVSNGGTTSGVAYNNGRGTIIACYNTGNVNGATGDHTGGVAGNNFSTITACYAATSVALGSGVPGTIFSSTNWPSTGASPEWGIGDGSGSGKYWKSLGGWNSGGSTVVYPKLWWE